MRQYIQILLGEKIVFLLRMILDVPNKNTKYIFFFQLKYMFLGNSSFVVKNIELGRIECRTSLDLAAN